MLTCLHEQHQQVDAMKNNKRKNIKTTAVLAFLALGMSCESGLEELADIEPSNEQWLAGDHHVHSRFSVGLDEKTNPPTPIVGGDAIYPIPMNVAMGRRFGLDWMVTTDHGGPDHAKITLEHAYPELLESRKATPEVIQYMGMEFDTPGADHSSIIMPIGEKEATNLFEIESRFNKKEPWPEDPSWDTEERMIEALEAMKKLEPAPVVIAHHPARSAKALGEYGLTGPAELRRWNNAAPGIAIGMEGAPGHQAIAQLRTRFGQPSNHSRYFAFVRPRGIYGRMLGGYPTMGGFDQMTARLGGFWDSMLGERRRWWITANSDSHIHWTDGGADFWPGEYSKTYVLAEKNPEAIFNSFRGGRVFVTTGDLISEVWFDARASSSEVVSIGSTLEADAGSTVVLNIKLLDPSNTNHNQENPTLERVDLIFGEFFDARVDLDADENPSAKVLKRWERVELETEGKYLTTKYVIEKIDEPFYVRLRGTNSKELEPLEDGENENPWEDLWFYTNPIFVEIDSS